MHQSDLEVPTRHEEESRIASNWLHRLQQLLQESNPHIFSQALHHAGISSQDFENGKAIRLNQLDMVQLFVREQVPDITLRMYHSSDLLDLGLIGYAMASSRTIGKAFEMAVRYHDVTSDRYQLIMGIEEEHAFIRQIPFVDHLNQYVDVAEELSGIWKILTQLLGPEPDYSKAHVLFQHEAPSYVESYHEVFKCPCTFGEQYNELRFPKDWLDYPVKTAHLATSAICASMIDRVLGGSTSASSTQDLVHRLILSRPGRHMLSLEEAASALNMTANQLRKRLYKAKTSYKQIILDLRMTLARHYLESTQLSVQEIGYLLDYSQAAPFSRAFKQYYGYPPQICRSESHASPANAV